MKRSTIYLIVGAAIFAVGMSAALAKGSSHPQSGDGAGNIVDAKVMPRAFMWGEKRLWQNTEGMIMVCPEFLNDIDHEKNCTPKNLKKGEKRDGWIFLQDYKIPGMELKGYEYRFVGSYGSLQLIAYYGPPTPEVKAEAPVVNINQPTLKFDGPVTIQAPKVTGQRTRKK